MPNTSINNTRRRLLKGAAYISALSMTGLSSLAFANKGKILDHSDIKIIQEKRGDSERVTLINQSNKLQMLDACRPISLHQIDGEFVVSVNQNDAEAVNGMVLMSPNEQFSFDVKAIGIEVADASDIPTLTNLAENQLQIVSEHSVFNRIVPVELA